MKSVLISLVIIGVICFMNPGAQAGMYTDDLSRCLVESTTSSEKMDLVKWMFIAMSLHPAVKSIASVSPEQVEDSTKTIAELFGKLVTVTCKEQAVKALKYEGQNSMETSFQVLGGVAARELFSDPDVAAGIAGVEKYLDAEKINKALGTAK